MAKPNILIIDDEEQIALLLEEFVLSYGMNATSTSSPETFYCILEEKEINLILLDIYMPDMDGRTLLKDLKSHPLYKSIPVIMVTGSDDEKLLATCFGLGAADFITKPVRSMVLQSRINTALKTQKYIKELADLNANLEKIVDEKTRDLQKSHQSLLKAQQIAHLGNWDWNIITGELLWTEEIYRIFGQKPAEFGATYEAFLSCVHPDDREFVQNSVSEALSANREYNIEHRIIRPDGTERIVHEIAEIYFDEEKKPAGMVGIVHDITERKNAEKAQKESEERLQSILDNTTSVIYLKDLQGKYLLINRRYEVLFHIKKDQIVGKTDYDFFPKEAAEKLQTNDREVLKAASPLEFEELVPHDDGMHTYISIKFPLFDSNNLPYGICGVSTDITERKLMEKRQRRHQEELAQAEKMISLGTLVATVAHEINNPNNNIILNMPTIRRIWKNTKPLIKKGMKAEEKKDIAHQSMENNINDFEKLLSLVEKGAERIAKIVSDLKNYVRADVVTRETNVDLKKVVRASIKHVDSQIQEKTCRFSFNFSPIPLIKGNPQKLGQVMDNLIINACQALTNPEQAVEIRVEHDKKKSLALVTIRDEGRGMDEKNLARIREPFFTTKHTDGGTGLGVSISHGIIQEHGGFLQYESEPGKGTTVVVSLPVSPMSKFSENRTLSNLS